MIRIRLVVYALVFANVSAMGGGSELAGFVDRSIRLRGKAFGGTSKGDAKVIVNGLMVRADGSWSRDIFNYARFAFSNDCEVIVEVRGIVRDGKVGGPYLSGMRVLGTWIEPRQSQQKLAHFISDDLQPSSAAAPAEDVEAIKSSGKRGPMPSL